VVIELEARVCCEGVDFPAKVRSLSVGGLFLETMRCPPFGSPIEVDLLLPEDESLHLSAVVRWTADTGFGVQFGLLGARETQVLADLVQTATESPSFARTAADRK
jgi:type IV pilus assembly protein PilZ